MLVVARDVSIILVAIESMIIGILLAVLVIQLSRLTKLLREEILPILTSAQETVSTVRGTTTFVGDHVVQPVVKLASVGAGVRGAVSALVGRRNTSNLGSPALPGGVGSDGSGEK